MKDFNVKLDHPCKSLVMTICVCIFRVFRSESEADVDDVSTTLESGHASPRRAQEKIALKEKPLTSMHIYIYIYIFNIFITYNIYIHIYIYYPLQGGSMGKEVL